jgi:hypothetical protein
MLLLELVFSRLGLEGLVALNLAQWELHPGTALLRAGYLSVLVVVPVVSVGGLRSALAKV